MITISGELVKTRQEVSRAGRVIFCHDLLLSYGVHSVFVEVKAWRDTPGDEFARGVTVMPGKPWNGKQPFWVYVEEEDNNADGA